MEKLFLTVLNMSVTASAAIIVVLLARLALRKAPKAFSYVLWAIVLFRLLCPLTIESRFALLPDYPDFQSSSIADDKGEIYIGTASETMSSTANDLSNDPVLSAYKVNPPFLTAPSWMPVLSGLWLAGAAALLGYSIWSMIKLRRKLVSFVQMEGENNVRLVDHIPSPFVLGLVFPKIYLPSDLSEHEQGYILLHERTHIRRMDHISRSLAWLALVMHWFNPLVWLAFSLAGKDMEMSCDEIVLRKMGQDIRTDYSTSLLRISIGGRLPAGPLAFGGGDLKRRIKNVLNYKKPALWVPVLALAAVLTMGAGLSADQSRLVIDPSTITSVASVTSSAGSSNRFVYTADERRKDILEPAKVHEVSEECGAELVRLINLYNKTVYAQGEFGSGDIDHNLYRITCEDGGYYLVDYWYWNGFNFNPFIRAGEDDYTTLVTHYDAEGNAGTTWQMEYYFDKAFKYWCWCYDVPNQYNLMQQEKFALDTSV